MIIGRPLSRRRNIRRRRGLLWWYKIRQQRGILWWLKNEKEQTWASEGDFYWKDEGYSLTENTKVTEIKVDGKPIEESIYAASEATLDWIDSLPIWEIVNTEKNEGYLKLTKTEYRGYCSS